MNSPRRGERLTRATSMPQPFRQSSATYQYERGAKVDFLNVLNGCRLLQKEYLLPNPTSVWLAIRTAPGDSKHLLR